MFSFDGLLYYLELGSATLYAVLSDIHANYQALLAVARDARALARREDDGRVEFISLGDVVDYGPQPNECVAWVRRYASVTVQGNHDRVAAESLITPPIRRMREQIRWDPHQPEFLPCKLISLIVAL